jgi:hypothetical protein
MWKKMRNVRLIIFGFAFNDYDHNLLEFDPFNCDGNKDCGQKDKDFFDNVNKLIRNK